MEPTLSLQVDALDSKYCRVSIIPPEPGQRTPVDVCCVVDISGSMATTATISTSSGVEGAGLIILDIVKHAVKTIIQSLGPEDRLSLVAFDDKARRDLALVKMDVAGKPKAMAAIEAMRTMGSTNIWAGLENGLELIREDNEPGRSAAVLLFTDGQPNIIPPEGHLPALKKYKDSHREFACTINTFGFGYNIDSKLLQELAEEGNGYYAFIPDSSFVGTVFVNAISDLLATAAIQVTLSLEPNNGAKIKSVVGTPRSDTTSWGAKIHVGSVKFGQSRDFVVEMSFPQSKSDDYISVTLNYVDPHSRQPATLTTDGTTYNSNEQESLKQLFRLRAVDAIHQAITSSNAQPGSEAAKAVISNLVSEISKSSVASDEYIVALLEDLTGQATEALSRADYFRKWGRHYLPSLARAHLLQYCNNFKDPGVQFYGGSLFKQLQDVLDDIFLKLPPPTPSASKASYSSYSYSPSSAPSSVSMASYYNSSNPCFDGSSLVLMADGTRKAVREICSGDKISSNEGFASVICVLKTICIGGKAQIVELPGGLRVTPWHPVLVNGEWRFPADVAELLIGEPCEAVFNFVLDNGHVMDINGVKCVTLGHDIQGPTVGHEYFGTSKIVKDLMQLSGWEKGMITLRGGCLLRGEDGLACGLNLDHEIICTTKKPRCSENISESYLSASLAI